VIAEQVEEAMLRQAPPPGHRLRGARERARQAPTPLRTEHPRAFPPPRRAA
jgi:hypothetical protein